MGKLSRTTAQIEAALTNAETSYQKPSTGIPKSDLSAIVQTILNRAVTREEYEGIDDIIQVRGFESSVGGCIYALPDEANGTEDDIIATKKSLKTINGESILGSGNIEIGGSPTSEDEVYIADFTMESLINGYHNRVQVTCDMQALVVAMNANKIILVRASEDSSNNGVYVLNGYAEDLLYFSIVDTFGNVLYCDGTDYVNDKTYIDGQTLFYRSWDDKQDRLVSGENIKTVNGQSLIGSGDIAISGGGGTGSGGGNAPEVVEVEATTKLGSTRVSFADILPNKIYICKEPIDQSVTISFAASSSTIENFTVIFRTSAAGVSLTVPDNVVFNDLPEFSSSEVQELMFRRVNWGDEEFIYGLCAGYK